MTLVDLSGLQLTSLGDGAFCRCANLTSVLSATKSTLMGDGGGQSYAVAVLGVVVHAETGAGGALWSAVVSNLLLSACTTVLVARDAMNSSSAAGIVATGGGWASLPLLGIVVYLAESNVSAIAGAAAAVGGVAVTGDTAFANDPPLLHVRVSDASWVLNPPRRLQHPHPTDHTMNCVRSIAAPPKRYHRRLSP